MSDWLQQQAAEQQEFEITQILKKVGSVLSREEFNLLKYATGVRDFPNKPKGGTNGINSEKN